MESVNVGFVILYGFTLIVISNEYMNTKHVAIAVSCASILVKHGSNTIVNGSCPYPDLFSTVKWACRPFQEIQCGQRTEPVSPCDYPATVCSWKNGTQTPRLCTCPQNRDLNYNLCNSRDDGLYPWAARMWTPYFIECKHNRTIPSQCTGHSVIFSFINKTCQTLHDVVNEAFKLKLSQEIPTSFLVMVNESLKIQPTKSKISKSKTSYSNATKNNHGFESGVNETSVYSHGDNGTVLENTFTNGPGMYTRNTRTRTVHILSSSMTDYDTAALQGSMTKAVGFKFHTKHGSSITTTQYLTSPPNAVTTEREKHGYSVQNRRSYSILTEFISMSLTSLADSIIHPNNAVAETISDVLIANSTPYIFTGSLMITTPMSDPTTSMDPLPLQPSSSSKCLFKNSDFDFSTKTLFPSTTNYVGLYEKTLTTSLELYTAIHLNSTSHSLLTHASMGNSFSKSVTGSDLHTSYSTLLDNSSLHATVETETMQTSYQSLRSDCLSHCSTQGITRQPVVPRSMYNDNELISERLQATLTSIPLLTQTDTAAYLTASTIHTQRSDALLRAEVKSTISPIVSLPLFSQPSLETITKFSVYKLSSAYRYITPAPISTTQTMPLSDSSVFMQFNTHSQGFIDGDNTDNNHLPKATHSLSSSSSLSLQKRLEDSSQNIMRNTPLFQHSHKLSPKNNTISLSLIPLRTKTTSILGSPNTVETPGHLTERDGTSSNTMFRSVYSANQQFQDSSSYQALQSSFSEPSVMYESATPFDILNKSTRFHKSNLNKLDQRNTVAPASIAYSLHDSYLRSSRSPLALTFTPLYGYHRKDSALHTHAVDHTNALRTPYVSKNGIFSSEIHTQSSVSKLSIDTTILSGFSPSVKHRTGTTNQLPNFATLNQFSTLFAPFENKASFQTSAYSPISKGISSPSNMLEPAEYSLLKTSYYNSHTSSVLQSLSSRETSITLNVSKSSVHEISEVDHSQSRQSMWATLIASRKTATVKMHKTSIQSPMPSATMQTKETSMDISSLSAPKSSSVSASKLPSVSLPLESFNSLKNITMPQMPNTSLDVRLSSMHVTSTRYPTSTQGLTRSMAIENVVSSAYLDTLLHSSRSLFTREDMSEPSVTVTSHTQSKIKPSFTSFAVSSTTSNVVMSLTHNTNILQTVKSSSVSSTDWTRKATSATTLSVGLVVGIATGAGTLVVVIVVIILVTVHVRRSPSLTEERITMHL